MEQSCTLTLETFLSVIAYTCSRLRSKLISGLTACPGRIGILAYSTPEEDPSITTFLR